MNTQVLLGVGSIICLGAKVAALISTKLDPFDSDSIQSAVQTVLIIAEVLRQFLSLIVSRVRLSTAAFPSSNAQSFWPSSSATTVNLAVRFAFWLLISLWLSRNASDSLLPYDVIAFVASLIALVAVFNTPPSEDPMAYHRLDSYPVNPKPPQSLFSIFSFGFMSDIMFKGTIQKITANDLYDLDSEFRAPYLFNLFDANYHPESSNSIWPFFRAIIPFFGWRFMLAWLFVCCNLVTELIQPKFIEWILNYLVADDDVYPRAYGWWLVGGVFLVAVLSPPIKEQYFNRMLVTGIKIRTGLVGAIYKKSLKLSSSARQIYTQGYIQTLQSVDAEVINLLPRQIFNGVFKANVQLAFVFYLLHQQIGVAFIPGFLIVVLSSPIQVSFTNKSGVQEKLRLEAMDRRIRLMGETLKGMLVVKFNNLSVPLQREIKTLRQKEMESIRVSLIYQSLAATVWQLQPFVIALSCFGTYIILLGNTLTPAKTFATLALLRLMNQPMNWLRNLFIQAKKIMVSARRIDAFLRANEIQPVCGDYNADEGYVRVSEKHIFGDESFDKTVAIVVRNARSSWSERDPISVNISELIVKKGELVAIVGRTGEGKSSLISTLLGEMCLKSGLVKIYGKIAYISQNAWILSGTIRENILFGKDFNAQTYYAILETCALTRDLELWDDGDLTEIGERGINLSGGQKQRISLARALYSDSEVYFFDDPLSALDAHVGKHVFNRVLRKDGGVLAGKTRILVTHGIHHLPSVDRILLISGGEIREEGSYDELVSIPGGEFAKLAEVMEADETKMRDAELRGAAEGSDGSVNSSPIVGSEVVTVAEAVADVRRIILAKQAKIGTTQLISEEEQAEGSVGWDAYQQYAAAFSVYGFIVCMVLSLLSNAFSICASWWLGLWSTESPENQTKAIGFYFGIYAIIMMIVAITGSVYTYMFRAVYALRFSKDVDTLCDSLPVSFADAMLEFIIIITGFAACTIATPLYIFMVLPLAYPYIWLQRHYLGTSRDLRRLHSITRSPIYQLLGESLDGLPTLRSYGMQNEFIHRLVTMADLNNNSWITNLYSSRWFDVRIDTVGLMTLFISAALCVVSKGYVDPGLAGLALIYASSNAGYLSFFVQDFCLLEVNIVSVERINEYVDCPKEISGNQEQNEPSDGWPHSGTLDFRKYSTRYRQNLDTVLKDLNFTINSGERVGIVGRTGSGKSSLVLAVTRILERTGGFIALDGFDISRLELKNLREQITVVPQEPVLFASTIRKNLDPFGKYNDRELWLTLEKTRMKEWVQAFPLKLDALISEGGSNLSVGERQLLCMAKALLQKSRILVLDEATSSIDIKTDELIQQILRKEFRNSTILCIAHRINTILDYDRILVLDSGRACEFDTPNALLANPDSLFASLCKNYQE
ncbi:hypothetical protein HK100_000585 [Physocladia obscura]|uniref:Uncharacterized protein n=1 Tax=Physocladia obscura TaxID=109957 RepID=A0AAD5XBQ1_9FUNG|nr:hypothetical protein HK100_000585 [Physocladia obscura]